jgi:hypothetical protein
MKGLIVPNYASSYPVEDIKRTLDAMSWVKVGIVGRPYRLVLNVIAQHVPLACSRLTEVCGSYAPSGEPNLLSVSLSFFPGSRNWQFKEHIQHNRDTRQMIWTRLYRMLRGLVFRSFLARRHS